MGAEMVEFISLPGANWHQRGLRSNAGCASCFVLGEIGRGCWDGEVGCEEIAGECWAEGEGVAQAILDKGLWCCGNVVFD